MFFLSPISRYRLAFRTLFSRNKTDQRPSSRAYVVHDTSDTHQGDTARVDGRCCRYRTPNATQPERA